MQYSLQVSTTENKSNYQVFVGILSSIVCFRKYSDTVHDRCVRGTRLSILFALHANNIEISSSHCFFQLNSSIAVVYLISNKAVILI